MGTNADEEYYAGPYCSPNDNFSIMIGMFSDDMCSVQVDSSVYTDVLGYDTELPYSRASVVDTECIDCRLPEDSNSQDDSIIPDVCIAVYYYAARCEEDMKVTNQDNSGCAFLQSMLASDVSAKETPLKNKKKKNKNKKPSKEKKLMYR